MSRYSKTTSLIARLVSVLLIIAVFGSTKTGTLNWSSRKLHPQLIQAAGQMPSQNVAVIVLKADQTNHAEQMTTKLGGKVTQSLHIINAFAAKVPAQRLRELATSDSVRWVSPDAPVIRSSTLQGSETSAPTNYYLDTLGVRNVWSLGVRGQGIGVAVVDSGVAIDKDFGHLTRQQSFNANSKTPNDVFGHGTHVAGIIGGSGSDSNGTFMGIAPEADLISLKISDENGMAYESDTVAALQWVLDNRATNNIRVVNLSVNSATAQSYRISPLDAAAEILWFNGIVVIASAGNTGTATLNAAPANDPFIITVGASDEKGTTEAADDIVAPYSGFAITNDGFTKPEIVAPGTSIYSVLSKNSSWASQYPDRVVLNGQYFRLSGTSMSAPMVAGAVALLLQDEPNLTPDQVKYRILATARVIGTGQSTRPYLNVYATVTGTTNESANTDIPASLLLWTGTDSPLWESVNWSSVNWSSVNWSSVNWSSVNWSSVNWSSTYWGK